MRVVEEARLEDDDDDGHFWPSVLRPSGQPPRGGWPLASRVGKRKKTKAKVKAWLLTNNNPISL